METATTIAEFSKKFGKLSKQNQKYIMGIQEALLYAQDSGPSKEEPKTKKENGG